MGMCAQVDNSACAEKCAQLDNRTCVEMSDQTHDSKINLQLPSGMDTSMEPSCTISPLPSDCIDQLYSNKGPAEGLNAHIVLEKSSGFSYRTLLGELMYAFITC